MKTKNFLNLKSWLLMMLMLIGVGGNLWAEEVTKTFNMSDISDFKKQSNVTYVINSVNWTLKTDGTGYMVLESSGNIHIGSGSNAVSYLSMETSDIPGNITKVVVTASNASNVTSSISVSVGGITYGDAQALSSTTSNYTFEGNSSGLIEIKLSQRSQKKALYLKTIQVTYEYGVTPSGPVAPAVSFAAEGISLEVGEKATNTITKPNDLTVTYSSNNTSVATVDATGEVTGVAAGNATITASWDAVANTYTAGSANYTVTVTEPVPAVVYEKVTNKNQLVAGNEYILVASTSSKSVAMGAQNGNYRNAVEVTIGDNKVSITDENVAVITLGGVSGAWTFLASDGKYLGMTKNDNYLNSVDEADANWTIEDDFQLSYNSYSRTLRYNASNPRFACYSSGQTAAYLYVKEGYAIDNKENASVSIDVTSLTVGGETAQITAVPEGLVMSYESSAPTIASVSNGVVTGLGHGSATITVSWEEQTVGEKTYNAGSREFEISVVDPNAPGTQNNPYTVAQALENTPSSGNSDNVYIKGIVSKFYKDDIISDGSNYRYYISDDGSTNSQLLVYKGKKSSTEEFSDAEDLQIGDVVVIYGQLTTYNNTQEINSGNYIVSLTRPVYEITAKSNNEALGTVSLDGNIITATLKDGSRYADPAFTVDAEGEVTVEQDGNEFVVVAKSNCTVTINFEAIPTHKVTWSINGETSEETVAEGAALSHETPADIDGKTFVGWVIAPIEGELENAPASLITNPVMGTADVTYYAVFASQEGSGDPTWTETALSALTASDTFVIVGNGYAMPHNNGTSSAPTATAVTIDDSNLTSTVTDNIKWNVSGNATDGYTFYPNGDDKKWLYCNTEAASGSNNNMRVGTGDRKVFELDTNGYLVTKDTYTTRYLSLYNSQDFRGYVTTSNGAFVPAFYKYSSNISYSGYCTTVDVPIRISTVEELKAFRDAVNTADKTVTSKNVLLVADLDLSGEENWTPIGNLVAYPGQSFDGVFDGNGHTIKNVTVVDQTTPEHAVAGLFGSVVNGTIKNLTVENVNLTSSHYAGGIVAYTSNKPIIENCHVIGGTITSVPELLNGSYDDGDKVGGIMGYATAGSTINNCTVEGLTIKAYRDMGGIVGYSAGNVSNNTVKNTTIIQSDVNAYKDYEITTYDYIVGRNDGATLENNVYEELNNVLTIDGAVAKIGDKLYRKLQAAVDAATEEDNVVTLLTDINLASDNVSINKAITINGDGHTITSSASAAVEVSGTGDVTISNTKIVATSGRGVQIGNLAHYSGKLTINEGSEITVAKRGINILDLDEGFELNVVNSIIQTNVEDPTTTYTTGEDSRGINFSNDPLAYNANITNTVIRGFSYDVNVYSGTENLTLTMVGGKSYGRDIINNWGKNNTFTLNGVEIHGLNNQTGPTEGFACVVDNEGSEHNTYVINNCQFIAVLSEAAMGEEGSSASEYMFALRGTNETVKVTGETTYTTNAPERGGFIESESQLAENTIYFDETAKGQFENSFVDYKVVTTETAPGFVVAVKEYVAQVGDVKYETLAEAVAAAENNTITLLANIADTYTLAEAQSLNVNLNGHTINVVAPEGYILQTSEADGVTTYSYVAPVAKIGETQFASLQAAVDAAQQLGGAQTINLLDNISDETVTIKEVANFQLTIDGKKDAESNYTVDAVIVVDGLRGNGGSTTNGASVTLQNIAFVKTTSTDGIQASHYPHHLTIQDCTYSGSDNDKWFLNASVDGPLYGVTVKNVTVEHARLIYANMADDAVFQNITATNDVKVGFNVKTSGTALIENCQVTTGKYAFRDYSDAYEGSFTLKDNTFISTSEASDEGVIVNRGGTVGTAHINVESGTYSGHIKVLNNKEGVLAISGGIFSESIAEAYCADGYICVANPDTETSEAYPYAVAPRPYVAQIGETQYYSLADAIAAVPADGTETTITMIDNEMIDVVGSSVTIASGKNVVLDLNGHQVVGTAESGKASALITNNGTLTIKDSSEDGAGKLISGATPTWTWDGSDNYSGSYASNTINNYGKLTVESGLIQNISTGSACYAIDNYSAGNIIINGGKVDAAKASAIRMFYVNGGSITVNDGVVGHYNSDEDYSYMGIQVMSGTNVNVSVAGGTIAGSYALYANNTGGSLAISGGIFDGYVGIAAAVPNDILSISGGTFNEWVGTWGDQTKFISGGTYSMKPDVEYIADGYIAAQQGNVYVVIPESEMPSAPTIFHDEGTYEGTLDVAIAGQGTIMYKLGDSEAQAYSAPFEISETTKVTAWAEQDGIKSAEVSKTFTIVEAQKGPSVTDGYYNIKAGDKYVNVAGRKTVTLVENAEGMPGTVIRVKATDGKVETLRSQGVDVPSYAQKAMNYVPEIVRLAVDKLHAEGAGELLGEHGLDAIMDKFDESFDYNLYLEGENNTYRIYGRTPSMKPVVDFYAENKDNVDAKLPQLEKFINQAIDKVLEKTGGRGAGILVDFDLETVWQKMGGTLTKPTDEASTAKFYEEVLTSEANVWNFAYQTAMIYWGNLKNNDTFKNNLDKLGDYAKYIDKVENIQPNFKYYIVPSTSGVDFISEGNIAITDNDPSVAWTMGECTEFKVNFDVVQNHTVYSTNGGVLAEYSERYTTLYTDFAYTLPDGVKAYKVKSISDKGVAVREVIEGTIPAQTPVLLVSSKEGAQTLTLTTEASTAVTGNLLVGADALINEYQIKTPQVETLFDLAKKVLGETAYNEYISKYEHLMLKNAGTVGNKYFFGLTTDDLGKCADDEGYIPVRSLGTKNGRTCFYENWQAGANKAFLVTERFDPVKLFLVGDVDRDGKISIGDVTALVNIILGKATYPEDNDKYDFEAAEVDGDKKISISDVTALVNIILGK